MPENDNQNQDAELLKTLEALGVDVSGLQNADGKIELTVEKLTELGLHVSFGPDGLVLEKVGAPKKPPEEEEPEEDEKDKLKPPVKPPQQMEGEKPVVVDNAKVNLALIELLNQEKAKVAELEGKGEGPAAEEDEKKKEEERKRKEKEEEGAKPAPTTQEQLAAPPPPGTTTPQKPEIQKHEDFSNDELKNHTFGKGAVALALSQNKQLMTGDTYEFEDFTVNTTDVDASGIEALITKDIWVELEPILVGRQLLQEDTILIGGIGHTRRYRKSTAISDAVDFVAGADVPGSDGLPYTGPPAVAAEAFSYVPCTPTKFGVAEIIFEEAIDEFDIDIIRHTQQSLAKSMARRDDRRVWDELLDVTEVSMADGVCTVGNAVATRFYMRSVIAGAPVDQIVEVTEVQVNAVAQVFGTDYWIDYFRGVIEFAVAPPNLETVGWSGAFSGRTNAQEATSIRHLSRDDIVDVKVLIEGTSYATPDVSVFNILQIGDILKDEQFTHAEKYGGTGPLMNGEVGETAGIKFMQSQRMYEGIGVVMKKGRDTGYYTWKKKLKAETEKMEKKAGDIRLKTWQKGTACVVNEEFIGVIYNMHRYARALTSGTIL